jgi:hypothetical protein
MYLLYSTHSKAEKRLEYATAAPEPFKFLLYLRRGAVRLLFLERHMRFPIPA